MNLVGIIVTRYFNVGHEMVTSPIPYSAICFIQPREALK